MKFFYLGITLAAFTTFPGGLSACDAEWHRTGEFPEWSRLSFSESNNPEFTDGNRRPKKSGKNKKRKPRKQEKPIIIYLEDIPEG